MKIVILVLTVGLVSGCKPKSVEPFNPDSIVSQKIILKDVTTGEKPGASRQAGYHGEWSYFGEKRTVGYTTDASDRVTTIKFSVGTDLDGQRLQEALEQKLSDEYRRKVAFDCREQPRRLAAVDNLAVTDTYCTLRSPTQKLTIKRQRPDNLADTLKYGNLGIIWTRRMSLWRKPRWKKLALGLSGRGPTPNIKGATTMQNATSDFI